MKKVVAVFLAVVVMISCTVISSAEEISVEDKVEYLISHGVPEDFLENKEKPDIDELYDSLYGEVFEFTGSQTVTLFESNGSPGISVLGIIPEGDMKLNISSVTYYDFDNSTSTKTKIKEVKIYVDYEWFDNKPSNSSTDGISVNWDSGLFTYKSSSFHSSDYKYIGSNWTEVFSADNPAQLNQGGLGYFAKMTSNNRITRQKGSAYFTLLPKQNIYNGIDKVCSINVEYVHDKNPIPGTISFSYQGVGVVINLSGLKDSVAKALNYYYKL